MIKTIDKYRVVCPVCGNTLFKSKNSDVEVECNRCKNSCLIKVTEDEIVYKLMLQPGKQAKACMA